MIQRTDALPVFWKVGVEEGAHLRAVRVGLGWVNKIHVPTLVMAVGRLSIRAPKYAYLDISRPAKSPAARHDSRSRTNATGPLP